MNLKFKATKGIEFIQKILDHNSNEVLWDKCLFAIVSNDSEGFIQVESIRTFEKNEDFWEFKKNFTFPYLSIGTLNNDLLIEIRTSDEFITACTDKSQKVLFYEDYTHFIFLDEPPSRIHKKMLDDLGFNYVLISSS